MGRSGMNNQSEAVRIQAEGCSSTQFGGTIEEKAG